MKKDSIKFKCSLCGKTIEGQAYNPLPLVGKKCCVACDFNYVMPVRKLMCSLYEKYEVEETPYEHFTKMLEEKGLKF